MPVKLYMDHNVPRAIAIGLRLRDVDLVTAYEDGSHTLADPAVLDRAAELGRVLFSQDDDLLVEAARRQGAGIPFGGVIYAHQMLTSIGVCVRDLAIIAKVVEPEDLQNAVQYLPL